MGLRRLRRPPPLRRHSPQSFGLLSSSFLDRPSLLILRLCRSGLGCPRGQTVVEVENPKNQPISDLQPQVAPSEKEAAASHESYRHSLKYLK